MDGTVSTDALSALRSNTYYSVRIFHDTIIPRFEQGVYSIRAFCIRAAARSISHIVSSAGSSVISRASSKPI